MVRQLWSTPVLVLLGVTPAKAQFPGGLELEPYAGAYIPLANMIDQEILGFSIKARQEEGLALGGRLALDGVGGDRILIAASVGAFQYIWPGGAVQ